MKLRVLFAIFLLAGLSFLSISQDAKEIIRKVDAKMRGEESSQNTMTMKIVRPTWDRTVTFKSWSKGPEYSLVLILAPVKEKGQTFLKRDKDMWNWNPIINRMIKIPTSMLSQGWMGSDFTNDDLLNESSIVVDYHHKLIGEEIISERNCYKIELIPKEDAPVVWGKIYMWISKKEYLQLKVEYYDEDDFLIKTEIGSKIKDMDGRILPTYFELALKEKPGHKTILTIETIIFNKPITDSFFSQQNMRRVR